MQTIYTVLRISLRFGAENMSGYWLKYTNHSYFVIHNIYIIYIFAP